MIIRVGMNSSLQKHITIPQYNYRIGYIFNKEKGLGVEINFDHTKWLFSEITRWFILKVKMNNHPIRGPGFVCRQLQPDLIPVLIIT